MLAIREVSYRYPHSGEHALAGIDLEINAGEIFGLLGPNGAGKTTLISLISGALPCMQGSIAVTGEPEAARGNRLALVPQEYAFYPMLTARENLVFFARVQGLHGARLASCVEQVVAIAGLEQTLDKLAGRCSGGLKRRLNLAIGLLNDPELLLLDEPTVGVDPQSRAFILETIKRLAGQGKTILYTSHYMEEVQYLCDRVAIMDRGRILLSGKLNDLLECHGGQCVNLGLNAVSAEQRAALEQLFPDVRCEGDEVVLPDFSEAHLARVLAWCAEHHIRIDRIRYGARDLEQLFLTLTHRSLRD